MTVIQIGLLIIESAVRFYFSYITAWLGQTVVKDMRIKVYEKVVGLNLRQFDQTPIGTLTTRTINDIEASMIFFLMACPDHCRPAFHYFYFVIYVLCGLADYIDCLDPFPILILATYYFKESVNRSFIKVRNAVAQSECFCAGAYNRHAGGAGICSRGKGI